MRILYHHRTAGDRVEYVHIMGMVKAFRDLGHTVEISSPPGCDPERRRPTPKPGAAGQAQEGSLRGRLKRFARKAPNVLFEAMELAYNAYSLFDMLKRRIRHGKPDLIYERTTSNSVVPTLLAGWWRIPIIQEVNVTTEIGRLRPLVLKRVTQGLERWMIRRTTLFLTVSKRFKEMMSEQGFPADRILVCQNAIDPETFSPEKVAAAERPENVGQSDVVIGYVGAFVPYHRLDRLLLVAHELAPDYPHVRWLLVGDGVERPKVEALLDEYGIRDRFWMPGSVVHEKVPSYLKAMDITVLSHSEQFNSPMKLFEYMAMARPVVVPDRPAIREVIADGVNGLRFTSDDVKSLREAIKQALDSADLRQRLGEQARRDILEKYTWVRNGEAVLERTRQLQE